MRDSIQRKIQLPRVGMRIVKSSIAVFLCFVFYSFFRSNGIIFYSQLAALWCIQPQWENTRSKALQRTVGTLTGAVFGLFVLLIDKRLMGTGLGGELVNTAHLPRRKERDILFISGMDDALLESDHRLSPYSIVELNRMLEDGANFTVSTMRTPASLIEPLRGIKLKLPVIAMDGAVMYDLNKNEYLHAYVISMETASKLQEFLQGFGINYFMNMILDNMLVIQYQKLQNDAEKDIYAKMHTSLYRNYTTMNLLPESLCIYFMVIQPKDKIEEIYERFMEKDEFRKLRILKYDSDDYPHYAYIKIYNENATRENMIAYLKKETGLEKTVTFGSIEGKYDVVVSEYDQNKVVKTLKKMYEPFLWEPKR